MLKIAIVGAGLVGRLLAHTLAQYHITLYDEHILGLNSCGYVAAGMLSPYAELMQAEKKIYDLGMRSLSLWPNILTQLQQKVFWQQKGSIVVAHGSDVNELKRLPATIQSRLGVQPRYQWLYQNEIKELEIELADRFSQAIYFSEEGMIDPHSLFSALHNDQFSWCEKKVENVKPYFVDEMQFDWVFDCRGLGAKKNWPQLRGVRGEIIRVFAPEVHFTRPIRLLHPRYAIYIVPRPHQHYVIGATSIESEDCSEISMQSALELLSSAFTVHRGFAEARIIAMNTQCRPALPNHLPEIRMQKGLTEINGLYRHGYLLAPALVEDVAQHFF